MANFNAPKKSENSGNSVPNIPSVCMRGECDGETDVAFLVIRNEKGRQLTGAFGQFGFRDHNGYQLKKGMTFQRWITRCSKCHYGDLLAAQKVYFKNKWCEQVIAGEVKDNAISKGDTQKYLDSIGSKTL